MMSRSPGRRKVSLLNAWRHSGEPRDAVVAALTSPPTDGGQPILAQAATAEVAHLPGRAIDRILAISVDAAGGETVTVSGILRRTRISYIGACRLSATLTDPTDGTVLGAGSGFAGAQVDYRPGKDSGDSASWLGFTSGSTSGSISGITTPVRVGCVPPLRRTGRRSRLGGDTGRLP